jgi:alkylation response protein AidB-like acyl-CoA dehydrogenase
LWAPHLPPEAGGTGQGFLAYADLNEEIGRSVWAQLVFNCQAPDAGNGEILHLFGTDEQKSTFLRPLVEGETRSFFSMTEPEVSGADPTGLRTTAVLDGDEWVIDGHKWFSSGAEGAGFGIVMAVTDPDAEPHGRMSQILVPADAPGLGIEPVPVSGHRGRGWSTHCEVWYSGVRVPVSNLLGGRGDGFRIAQKRLGPGRIHHVMRWLGQMQRAFELMCSYALEREAFGGRLADKQTVQNWIADSAAEIQACRFMTLDAARKIDAGDEARVEISLIKFYAARVLNEVIDRAVQVHGALGLTDRTPLATMLTHARAGRIYDGPDEVHRMVVSRRILKEFAAGGTWRFS